jgi:hypothetical protein
LIIYDDENKSDLHKIKNFLNLLENKKKLKPIKIELIKKIVWSGLFKKCWYKKSNTKYIAFLDSDDYGKKINLNFKLNLWKK